MRAIREICIRQKIELRVTSIGPATPGNYQGDSLVAHIHKWYEEKYGDRLKINLSPGSAAVIIKGDAGKLTSHYFTETLDLFLTQI